MLPSGVGGRSYLLCPPPPVLIISSYTLPNGLKGLKVIVWSKDQSQGQIQDFERWARGGGGASACGHYRSVLTAGQLSS